jgi:hypothetical protein
MNPTVPNGGSGGGQTTVVQTTSNAGLLAGFVSFGVAQILILLVERVELLLVLTALLAGLIVGVRRMYEERALRDKRIDRCESFVLDSLAFMKLVLFFCAGQYVVVIMKNLLMLNNQSLPCIVLMLGCLIFLGLSFIPFVTDTYFVAQLKSPVDELRRLLEAEEDGEE